MEVWSPRYSNFVYHEERFLVILFWEHEPHVLLPMRSMSFSFWKKEILCITLFVLQEKSGKRAAEEENVFSRFKKKKDGSDAKSAMIPREEVCLFEGRYNVLNLWESGARNVFLLQKYTYFQRLFLFLFSKGNSKTQGKGRAN